jgi:hypothetical protein
VGDRRLQAAAHQMLGQLELARGQPRAAQAAIERAEALYRASGDRIELGRMLCVKARAQRVLGDEEGALAALGEARALAVSVGAPDSVLVRELERLEGG